MELSHSLKKKNGTFSCEPSSKILLSSPSSAKKVGLRVNF